MSKEESVQDSSPRRVIEVSGPLRTGHADGMTYTYSDVIEVEIPPWNPRTPSIDVVAHVEGTLRSWDPPPPRNWFQRSWDKVFPNPPAVYPVYDDDLREEGKRLAGIIAIAPTSGLAYEIEAAYTKGYLASQDHAFVTGYLAGLRADTRDRDAILSLDRRT